MDHDRRTFLKTSSIVGMAAMTGASLATKAAAQGGARTAEPAQLPKGMTFATLRRGDGFGLGLRTERGILDVVAAEQDFREGAPTSIDAVFKGQGDISGLKRLAAKAGASASAQRYFVAADQAAFGPCVTNPEKIVCIGLNYRKHAAETGNPVPKQPILFNKYNTALNCCGGEIAASKEKAEKFGYCTGNDFTARDLQSRSSQWMLGKSLDGSGPIGPWLVTADQVDGDNLKIECRVNGEVRQSSNTSDMVFNCKQLVSYISHHMTLKPGDLIFTGTPSGVISGYPKDKQVWLKPGDTIVTSIEKLGDLTFTLT